MGADGYAYPSLCEVKRKKNSLVIVIADLEVSRVEFRLKSLETEFPSIVIDDAFELLDALPCKSQVSTPVNDEIDFRLSFDESDDEDYTIICDKNSFSYKMISVNNLKTDSENDNEKVMPSIPPPEPTVSCFDELDFFKDFENEFPAGHLGRPTKYRHGVHLSD
ncbi:hypothetical protein Tco_0339910 [Tanacetum coccineum]